MGALILTGYLVVQIILYQYELIAPSLGVLPSVHPFETLQLLVSIVTVVLLVTLGVFWGFIMLPMEKMIVTKSQALVDEAYKQRDIEKKLREANQELDRFFVSALDMLCIADTEGYFRRLNDEWEHVLGYKREELEGKSFLSFVHPEDMDETLSAISTLREQKPILNFTNRYRHIDGSYRYIEWRSFPVDKVIYASARDISERRNMEQALAESELRYRSLVNNLFNGVVLHDQDGSILMVNPSAEKILGLTADQMRGLTSIDPIWHTIHEDGSLFPGETHPSSIALQTGKAVQDVVMGVYKPDKSLTWILVNAQPVVIEGTNTPSSTVVSFTDITELKRLSKLEVEIQSERARGDILASFITNTSHELRTPLTIINSGLYILQKSQDPAKRAEKAAQVMYQVRHLDRIITQLQEMLRLNQVHELTLTWQSAQGILERFTRHYPLKRAGVGVAVRAYDGVDTPNIHGNTEYVMLALGYLVDNAVRYSPDGEEILLYVESTGTEVRLCVEDHGDGIAYEHVGRIFDQFYKVDSSRTQNDTATGMGLTMTRRIMELHDGQVKILSHGAGQTVFALCFPMKL